MKNHLVWPAAAAILLSACGGGDGSSSLKLAVADAPVDGAQHVVVEFTGVELLPGSGDAPVTIGFDAPKTIDLLTESGTASAVLFDQPVPAGHYTQIRLEVVADGDPGHSYIQLEDGSVHGLKVPSGDQTGLKLVSGFEVPDSGVAFYTVDFDLRKAITCPPGQNDQCFLRPALRLVNNAQVGGIQGIVDATLVTDGCTPGVYLYNGDVTAPEDMNSTADASDTNQPLASKAPVETSNGLYYQFSFLPPGDYTVAYTCGAAGDNPDADDGLSFAPVKTGITVSAGQTTSVNLP